jgi:hypothetical protein
VDLVIPAAQGFELEGLGFLGSGKTKAVPLDKESFRD